MEFHSLLLPFVQEILMILVTAGVAFFVAFLKKKLGVEKIKKLQQESEFIKQIVLAGVQYAEQRYKSGEKLDKAAEWITARLNERGIKISQEEVEGLIEATLRQLKDQFGEEWSKVTKDNKIK